MIVDGAAFEDSALRPLFHFFDPLHDEGLLFFTSPNWALEDRGKIHLLQNYSLNDAREYLHKALTQRDDRERKRYFGKTFESLGRVIHHIQDMTQPQHVRLDAHLNLDWTDEELPFENRSRYEQWGLAHPEELAPHLDAWPYVSQLPDVGAGVVYDTARGFWTGGVSGAGQGLADFTNRNFLSAGTLWTDPSTPSSRYPSPVWSGEDPEVARFEDLMARERDCLPPGYDPNCGNECGPPPDPSTYTLPPACRLTGEMWFYPTAVVDRYSGFTERNPRAATLSIFDQDLKPRSRQLFALNRFNFRETYPFLLPRAVAYSAGLINYFFRGRLEVNDVMDAGDRLIIRIKNISGAGNPLKNGSFTLYYDGPDGTRTQVAVRENGAVAQLDHDAVHALVTNKPGYMNQDRKKEKPLILVYRGLIGSEEAVAAVTLKMPLSGFLVDPGYAPRDGVLGWRHVYYNHENSRWDLGDRIDLIAGNVDWKGWYVNGSPTKVLTWIGTPSRYFPDPRRPGNNRIFQDGEIFATTPLWVLGAALHRDEAGKEWLIAICWDGKDMADVVYRRPNKKSNSSALYHPVTEPEGWQEIGRFSHASADPRLSPADTPWFFNGNGTEAQTMRSGFKKTGTGEIAWLYRLKISIAGGSASLSNEGNLDGIVMDARTESATCSYPPAKVTACGADCTGTTTTESASSVSADVEHRDGGSFYLAVDYVDDRPVYAKLTLAGRATRRHGFESRYNSLGQCQAGWSCRVSNILTTSSQNISYSLDEDSESVLDIGSETLVLSSRKGSSQTSVTWQYTATGSDTPVDTTTGSGGSTVVQVNNVLRYLDLRYGLYSIFSQKTSMESSADPSVVIGSQGRTLPLQATVNTNQWIKFKGSEIAVNKAPQYQTGTDVVLGFGYTCNAQKSSDGYLVGFTPTILYDPQNRWDESRWMVDSADKLLAYETRRHRNMQITGTFSYLSGSSNLGEAVPDAPENALYQIPGLIK